MTFYKFLEFPGNLDIRREALNPLKRWMALAKEPNQSFENQDGCIIDA